MLEKFKALPKSVQIVIGIVAVGLILGALSACTQPPMKFDFLPEHTG